VKEEKKKANILSSDRSKNIEIRISQFKKIGFENLFNIIDTMDQENKLSIESVEALLRCIPEGDEEKELKKFDGPQSMLTEAEKFMMRIVQSTHFEPRLKVLRVSRLFDQEAVLISQKVEIVCKACKEVLECTKLAGVFELVLALGNTLNKKKTNGFRVQSLLKLVETKSNKAKITMLHYLASVVESRMEHLIDFPDELPTIEEASGISVENVASTFQALQSVVHDSTVGSGLVNPNVVARLAAGEDIYANANQAMKFATEFYIKEHLFELSQAL